MTTNRLLTICLIAIFLQGVSIVALTWRMSMLEERLNGSTGQPVQAQPRKEIMT